MEAEAAGPADGIVSVDDDAVDSVDMPFACGSDTVSVAVESAPLSEARSWRTKRTISEIADQHCDFIR